VDGREVFVKKGDRFGDTDPMVKRVPAIMEQVSVDAPSPQARAIRTVLGGKGKDDGG
jgi:hypothetical protein